MNFIQVTWHQTGKPLFLNINQIVGFREYNELTMIYLAVTGEKSMESRVVDESPEDLLSLIRDAKLGG